MALSFIEQAISYFLQAYHKLPAKEFFAKFGCKGWESFADKEKLGEG
jgi:hypothetical protein